VTQLFGIPEQFDQTAPPTKGYGMDFIKWLHSDPGQAALAGAAGGLVRWLTLRDSWRDGLASLFVGGICAIYLSPLAQPVLQPVFGAISPGGDAGSFAAFVVGLGGIALSGMVIDLTRRFRAEHGGASDT
jgi:hypothetical protein